VRDVSRHAEDVESGTHDARWRRGSTEASVDVYISGLRQTGKPRWRLVGVARDDDAVGEEQVQLKTDDKHRRDRMEARFDSCKLWAGSKMWCLEEEALLRDVKR
jgi:hypothetical protein